MTLTSSLLTYLQQHPHPLRTIPTTLHLAQSAPAFLASAESKKESQEVWLLHEQLLLACLRVSDDTSALLLLHRLEKRFGKDTPRIKALRGIHDEAVAKDDAELIKVLKGYEDELNADPTNLAIEKRRIALLLSLNRPTDAITALCNLLSHSPTDAESWSHLAELYHTQGLYSQSIFCLEECLIISPNAYNIFARLGETTYVSEPNNPEKLAEAIRYYCRSVELCEWYLRGWYGLRVVAGRVVKGEGVEKNGEGMEKGKAERLWRLAGEKLKVIVGKSRKGEKGWTGFDKAEVEAAEELLKEGA